MSEAWTRVGATYELIDDRHLDPDGDGLPLPSSVDETAIASFLMDRYREHGERDNATVVVPRMEMR